MNTHASYIYPERGVVATIPHIYSFLHLLAFVNYYDKPIYIYLYTHKAFVVIYVMYTSHLPSYPQR